MVVRPLNTVLKLKAQEELNETTDRIQQDLQIIRDWLQKTNHMKCREDDQFLIAFLRGSKYNFDKVKKKIDLYYKRKIVAPEIFPPCKATDPKIIELLRLG